MIYISITTVPLRLKCWDLIRENLNSLLNQKTDKEYYVALSVPLSYTINHNEVYVIPNELIEFAKNNPKLIINRETYDYGPIVKIIGGLRYANNPDDIIIACDDDHVYHEEMLEYYVKKLNEHPDNAICFRGDMALDKRIWTENGTKKFVFYPDDILFPVNRDCYLGIPGHWHSVGYWRRFFEEDFNEDLWKLADGDDVIMGYYLKKHKHFALCVVWDKETDFRPIANNRPSETFPIVRNVPYTEYSGGWLIRTKAQQTEQKEFVGQHGREDSKIRNFLLDYNIIYTENINNI